MKITIETGKSKTQEEKRAAKLRMKSRIKKIQRLWLPKNSSKTKITLAYISLFMIILIIIAAKNYYYKFTFCTKLQNNIIDSLGKDYYYGGTTKSVRTKLYEDLWINNCEIMYRPSLNEIIYVITKNN